MHVYVTKCTQLCTERLIIDVFWSKIDRNIACVIIFSAFCRRKWFNWHVPSSHSCWWKTDHKNTTSS